MTTEQSPQQDNTIPPDTLKATFKAFKKRLKPTALDEDSRLGRGPFSGGRTGVYAIRPPDQYPSEVWRELYRQGKLRDSGHGLYELHKDSKPGSDAF